MTRWPMTNDQRELRRTLGSTSERLRRTSDTRARGRGPWAGNCLILNSTAQTFRLVYRTVAEPQRCRNCARSALSIYRLDEGLPDLVLSSARHPLRIISGFFFWPIPGAGCLLSVTTTVAPRGRHTAWMAARNESSALSTKRDPLTGWWNWGARRGGFT